MDTGDELARQLALHDWDYIIAGDGSGTTWDKTIGYGSILYCRQDGKHKKFFGGMSHGTNNIAEMLAVCVPLLFLDGMSMNWKNWSPNVYILSDSMYVVQTGNGDWTKRTNHLLWSVMDTARSKMNLIFLHVNRMLLPANVFGDHIGNAVRWQLQEIANQIEIPNT